MRVALAARRRVERRRCLDLPRIADPSAEHRTLVLLSGTDVTERRRQEEEIRASRARSSSPPTRPAAGSSGTCTTGHSNGLCPSLSLRLAQTKLATDPAAAAEIITGASDELAHALEELRELARGIHPAVLTDRGLSAALESLTARTPLPVELTTLDGQLPEPIAAAAYYVVSEAIANIVKHAEASSVRVRVSSTPDSVVIEVADDGIGGADTSGGSGLRGLRDRLAALDGRLGIDSPPGGGTCVVAEIPTRRPVATS